MGNSERIETRLAHSAGRSAIRPAVGFPELPDQMVSGTITMAPQGHSVRQMPQPLQ